MLADFGGIPGLELLIGTPDLKLLILIPVSQKHFPYPAVTRSMEDTLSPSGLLELWCNVS